MGGTPGSHSSEGEPCQLHGSRNHVCVAGGQESIQKKPVEHHFIDMEPGRALKGKVKSGTLPSKSNP